MFADQTRGCSSSKAAAAAEDEVQPVEVLERLDVAAVVGCMVGPPAAGPPWISPAFAGALRSVMVRPRPRTPPANGCGKLISTTDRFTSPACANALLLCTSPRALVGAPRDAEVHGLDHVAP